MKLRGMKALSITLFFLVAANIIFAQNKNYPEVAKGATPREFLDKNLNVLPWGVKIWDSPQAIEALNKGDQNILWVDNRPIAMIKVGTIKGAIPLYCDLKTAPITDADKPNDITEQKLKDAMKKVNPDISKVTIVYFCQGIECHMSYNATLRSVNEFGINPQQIIWFREGYPGISAYINNDPKLKKKITKYLVGTEITE